MTDTNPELEYVVESPSVALARVEASVEALAARTEQLRRDVHSAVADCQWQVSSAIRRAGMALRFAAAERDADNAAVRLDDDLVSDFVGECVAELDQAETEKLADTPVEE